MATNTAQATPVTPGAFWPCSQTKASYHPQHGPVDEGLLPGASVRISGCVDDGLQGRGSIGITATTNASGIAYFKEHAENSIQYCWGSARDKCKIEVVGGAGGATYPTLGLVHNYRLVSPLEWICQAKGCCHPCAPENRAEVQCTKFIDYGTLEFRPTGNCPRSCCADECRVLWTEPGSRSAQWATGTCSSHFDEEDDDRRRSLLQVAEEAAAAAPDSELPVSEVPEDAIFLNDDGSMPEVVANQPGRRMLTDDECPSGWRDSGKSCALRGCGTCCIRRRR
ncbi:hypothetical protein OEZ85_004778 [Tetradesmus obliquus]|uniref:Uncharacterized protein n=1 Tax=Tetradesmus obliquus TaxID=3088 RepID=A0ABY8UMK5_TETOB|nr:hypothetical protein OEZ85_004778 [Tetradesmus obliquus]